MLGDSHKYFTSVNHIFPLHQLTLKYSLFGSHISFLANAYEVFTAIHKYFTLDSHICSQLQRQLLVP